MGHSLTKHSKILRWRKRRWNEHLDYHYSAPLRSGKLPYQITKTLLLSGIRNTRRRRGGGGAAVEGTALCISRANNTSRITCHRATTRYRSCGRPPRTTPLRQTLENDTICGRWQTPRVSRMTRYTDGAGPSTGPPANWGHTTADRCQLRGGRLDRREVSPACGWARGPARSGAATPAASAEPASPRPPATRTRPRRRYIARRTGRNSTPPCRSNF